MAKESQLKKRIIIRAVVGCVLPHNAILIGQGDFLVRPGDLMQYYDYEICVDDHELFIIENKDILIENNLLVIEKTEEELKAEMEKLEKERIPVITPNGYIQRRYQ